MIAVAGGRWRVMEGGRWMGFGSALGSDSEESADLEMCLWKCDGSRRAMMSLTFQDCSRLKLPSLSSSSLPAAWSGLATKSAKHIRLNLSILTSLSCAILGLDRSWSLKSKSNYLTLLVVLPTYLISLSVLISESPRPRGSPLACHEKIPSLRRP